MGHCAEWLGVKPRSLLPGTMDEFQGIKEELRSIPIDDAEAVAQVLDFAEKFMVSCTEIVELLDAYETNGASLGSNFHQAKAFSKDDWLTRAQRVSIADNPPSVYLHHTNEVAQRTLRELLVWLPEVPEMFRCYQRVILSTSSRADEAVVAKEKADSAASEARDKLKTVERRLRYYEKQARKKRTGHMANMLGIRLGEEADPEIEDFVAEDVPVYTEVQMRQIKKEASEKYSSQVVELKMELSDARTAASRERTSMQDELRRQFEDKEKDIRAEGEARVHRVEEHFRHIAQSLMTVRATMEQVTRRGSSSGGSDDGMAVLRAMVADLPQTIELPASDSNHEIDTAAVAQRLRQSVIDMKGPSLGPSTIPQPASRPGSVAAPSLPSTNPTPGGSRAPSRQSTRPGEDSTAVGRSTASAASAAAAPVAAAAAAVVVGPTTGTAASTASGAVTGLSQPSGPSRGTRTEPAAVAAGPDNLGDRAVQFTPNPDEVVFVNKSDPPSAASGSAASAAAAAASSVTPASAVPSKSTKSKSGKASKKKASGSPPKTPPVPLAAAPSAGAVTAPPATAAAASPAQQAQAPPASTYAGPDMDRLRQFQDKPAAGAEAGDDVDVDECVRLSGTGAKTQPAREPRGDMSSLLNSLGDDEAVAGRAPDEGDATPATEYRYTELGADPNDPTAQAGSRIVLPGAQAPRGGRSEKPVERIDAGAHRRKSLMAFAADMDEYVSDEDEPAVDGEEKQDTTHAAVPSEKRVMKQPRSKARPARRLEPADESESSRPNTGDASPERVDNAGRVRTHLVQMSRSESPGSGSETEVDTPGVRTSTAQSSRQRAGGVVGIGHRRGERGPVGAVEAVEGQHVGPVVARPQVSVRTAAQGMPQRENEAGEIGHSPLGLVTSIGRRALPKLRKGIPPPCSPEGTADWSDSPGRQCFEDDWGHVSVAEQGTQTDGTPVVTPQALAKCGMPEIVHLIQEIPEVRLRARFMQVVASYRRRNVDHIYVVCGYCRRTCDPEEAEGGPSNLRVLTPAALASRRRGSQAKRCEVGMVTAKQLDSTWGSAPRLLHRRMRRNESCPG